MNTITYRHCWWRLLPLYSVLLCVAASAETLQDYKSLVRLYIAEYLDSTNSPVFVSGPPEVLHIACDETISEIAYSISIPTNTTAELVEAEDAINDKYLLHYKVRLSDDAVYDIIPCETRIAKQVLPVIRSQTLAGTNIGYVYTMDADEFEQCVTLEPMPYIDVTYKWLYNNHVIDDDFGTGKITGMGGASSLNLCRHIVQVWLGAGMYQLEMSTACGIVLSEPLYIEYKVAVPSIVEDGTNIVVHAGDNVDHTIRFQYFYYGMLELMSPRWEKLCDKGEVSVCIKPPCYFVDSFSLSNAQPQDGGQYYYIMSSRGQDGYGLFLEVIIPSGGIAWNSTMSISSEWLWGVTFGMGRFVSVGGEGKIYESVDANSWNECLSPTTNTLWGVGYGNGRFVAVGNNGVIAVSTNGTAWSLAESGTSFHLTDVTHDGKQFVCVGHQGTVLTSKDGFSPWILRPTGITAPFTDITYGGGRYLACGNGVIAHSTNAIDWVQEVEGNGKYLTASGFGHDRWHVGGASGIILTSTNLVDWTTNATGLTSLQAGMADGVGRFIAVGGTGSGSDGGTVLITTNGTSWQTARTGPLPSLYDVAYGNGTWVAVGQTGAVLRSKQMFAPWALTATPSGGGTILKDPDQEWFDYPGSSYPYPYWGQDVTLTAVPDPGYEFAGWGGDIQRYESSTLIDMSTNWTVHAYFKLTNRPPVIDVIAEQTINEMEEFVWNISATDVDEPAQKLAFQILDSPANATIDPDSGRFAWTPSEIQGPTNATVTVVVTDNGSPSLSATNQFAVHVLEVNRPPAIEPRSRQTVDEGQLLSIGILGTDPDVPVRPLAYRVMNAPPGVTLDPATGLLEWQPAEDQGPSTNTIIVAVDDGGVPPLSATNELEVVVLEVNQGPVLTPIGNRGLSELGLLRVTCRASDADLPAQTLSYRLVDGPSGVTLNPVSGVLDWWPTEAQGPSTNIIVVAVDDHGNPALSDTNQFQVIVTEVNQAPAIAAMDDRTIGEGQELAFAVPATDGDIPANHLSFVLKAGPPGMTIDSGTGALSWIPSETQGGSTWSVTVTVTDDANPPLTAERSFQVTAEEVNSTPEIGAIADQTVNELSELRIQVVATDADIPEQQLLFSLANPPADAAIHAQTGILTWTPGEDQGPAVIELTVQVRDFGDPVAVVQKSFTVTVLETNEPPVLEAVADRTVDPGKELAIQLVAGDPDLPTNALTFAVVSGPSGLAVHPTTGILTWTPTEPKGQTAFPVHVRVTDDGSPAMSDDQTFQITVRSEPPVVAIRSPAPGATHDERVTLEGEVSDNTQVTSASWQRDREPMGALSLENGRFEVAGLRLKSGENIFQVTARDEGDNEATAEVRVTWEPLRTVQVGDAADVQEGNRIAVPVSLTSQGEVGAMTFTIHYEPEYLRDPAVAWREALGNGTATMNPDIPGQLRATFSLGGQAVPAGTQSLATVTFRTRSVPFDLTTTLMPEVVDIGDAAGNKLEYGTDILPGSARILLRHFLGDNNGNNRLDVGDAILIQRLLTGLDEVRIWDVRGNDLNASGDLDASDVTKVLRVVVGLDALPGPVVLSGRDRRAGATVAASASPAESALIAPSRLTGRPGERIRLEIVLTNIQEELAGAAFRLVYPTNALRVINASDHSAGPLVPAAAVVIWNLGPSPNDYSSQSGELIFAASRATPWPASNGVLATVNLEVQPDATSQSSWEISLAGVEITANGYEIRSLPDFVAEFDVRPEEPPTIDPAACGWTPEGFRLTVQGRTGTRCVVEYSDDLKEWHILSEETLAETPAVVTDPASNDRPYRYYRAHIR